MICDTHGYITACIDSRLTVNLAVTVRVWHTGKLLRAGTAACCGVRINLARQNLMQLSAIAVNMASRCCMALFMQAEVFNRSLGSFLFWKTSGLTAVHSR